MEPESWDSPGASAQPGLHELLGELQAQLQAVRESRQRTRELLEALAAIGTDLDLRTMLRRAAEAAVMLADARYAAVGVLGPGGRLAEFASAGLDEAEIAGIGRWPENSGVLGLLIRDDPRPLRLADVSRHPYCAGFPAGHPVMRSFLGVPLRVRRQVCGSLYLAGKRNGEEFTAEDETMVSALGSVAGVLVENARLHGQRQRQDW